MVCKRLDIIIYNLILALIYSSSAYAYDDKITHPDLTKMAIASSQLETYLMQNYGNQFADGIKQTHLYGKSVIDWLTGGSTDEDSPNCRASNHFHNPLKPWNESAMSDEPLWLDAVCFGWKPWYSNIVWATGQQSPGSSVIQRNNQTMGWDGARNYFYLALTSAKSSDREIYFSKTFQSVGQVMHLLEDMAVPAHVRNDFKSHLTFNGVTSVNPIKWYGNPFEFYVQNNPNLIASATAAMPSFTKQRVTDFWDTDGQTSGSLGLAEITNAGYFSDSTIPNNNPTPEHMFTSPQINIDSTNQYLCKDYLPGENKPTKYVSRKPCPVNGSGVDHFAAISLINSEAETLGNSPQIKEVWLDNNVHNTYAKELLPRAVGYSAALLDYFFRGTIEITPPAQNVYAITDGSITPYTDTYGHQHQEFNRIKAKVRNTTPNETAGAGTLQAIAKYKMRIDYQPDLSGDPTDEHPEWGVSENEYSYSTSAPISIASLDSSQSVEFSFDFAASPIPAGVTDLYLQVVFRGTIGNEAINAIAVGMKDLAEPAHHVFWNLSDQFSLGSEVTSTMVYYHLYTEDIISTTATLRNIVDLKPTGHPNGVLNEQGEPYISPFPMTFEIAYINEIPPTTTPLPVARVGNLPAGQYIRLVIIQDREQPRIVHLSYSDQIEPGVVDKSDQQFQAVINQTEPDGYFYYMPVDTFRHGSSGDPIRHHFHTGILRCYPKLSGDYCPYNETESIPVDPNPYPAEIIFDN